MFNLANRGIALFACCGMAIGGGFQQVTAGELVIVRLVDGGRRVGEIDRRTDQEQLWLHTSDLGVVLQSAVPWNRIESAEVRGEAFSVADLQSLAERQNMPPPAVLVLPKGKEPQERRLALRPAVDSISITAELANWMRDPLPDGLKLRLLPVGADGQTVPVNGLVTVRLFGRRVPSYERLETSAPFAFWTNGSSIREYDPSVRTERYFEIGRWTRRIRLGQFDEWGATLRLPYQTVNPERDLDVDLDGVVDVTLRVDGQGIHHASVPLELRTFGRYREELQLNRRQRYVPGE